jgi:hypothetical protein
LRKGPEHHENQEPTGKHRVGALVGVLQHVVGGVVDQVCVITGTADQQIDAGSAGQRFASALP